MGPEPALYRRFLTIGLAWLNLGQEKRRHADDLMSRPLQDPEVAGLIRQKLRELGPV